MYDAFASVLNEEDEEDDTSPFVASSFIESVGSDGQLWRGPAACLGPLVDVLTEADHEDAEEKALDVMDMLEKEILVM